ncbi:hypothetical protein NEPTK9_001545 [Candidatus Neptunochlamydia vexilliferae]|uniref:Uncharacterized protein n=1 Tax=Candidatus Neptunichlamydia vexilliferae TaxID=1651774 RepID=A0ABS0B0U9_9BACT|nr:hypothetical protein [Candidatus Neptunochlamydia vexilliferae]
MYIFFSLQKFFQSKTCILFLIKESHFLGYVVFLHHTLLRTKTKKRMFKKLNKKHEKFFKGQVSEESLHQSIHSYLGILSHADQHEVSQTVTNAFWR